MIMCEDLLRRLNFLMDLADRSFENYLTNKFYLHALCIRKNNRAIYDFVIENITGLPVELHPHLRLLLSHYDIWMTQFEHFEKSESFALNDPFVFYHLDDKSAYPKTAVAAVRAYLQRL